MHESKTLRKDNMECNIYYLSQYKNFHTSQSLYYFFGMKFHNVMSIMLQQWLNLLDPIYFWSFCQKKVVVTTQ